MSAAAEGVRVRAVTDAEIAAYRERGWVRLPELISPDAAGSLLDAAKRWMGSEGDTHDPRPGKDIARIFFQVYNEPSHDDPRFEQLVSGGELGRNAARLLGRDSSIRILDENVAVKLPADKGDPPTTIHQDGPFLPFDRVSVNFWIALDEVTPEMGLMRFRSGSQRLGPLGRSLWKTDEDLLASWPALADCLSEQPARLAPGDATAHSSLTVHSAPANGTALPRWSYLITCYPGDALNTIWHRRTEDLDLEPLKPLEHPRFTLIYEPAAAG